MSVHQSSKTHPVIPAQAISLAREVHELFDCLADPVQVLDLAGRVIFMNPAALAALNIPDFTTVFGQNCACLWPDASRRGLADAVRRVEQGANATLAVSAATPDGKTRWWDISFSPLWQSGGTPGHVVAISHDVTGHRQREGELMTRLASREAALVAQSARLARESHRLAQARMAAQRADRFRLIGAMVDGVVVDASRLVGDVGHVIRAISTSSGFFARRRLKSSLRALEAEASRVRDLLDDAGRGVAKAENIAPASVIGEISGVLSKLLGPRVRLEIDGPADGWPVRVRAEELQRLIIGFAVDAGAAMRGVGTLSIETHCITAEACPPELPVGAYVQIVIADSGCGLSVDGCAQSNLGACPRAKPSARLRSAQDFANSLGGAATVEDRGCAGNRVSVALPRASVRGSLLLRGELVIDSRAHGGGHILLVDSDDATRLDLCALLRAHGYTVIAANSAEMALGVFVAADRLDLMVADLSTLRRSGFDLAAQLWSRDPDIPVIYLADGTAQNRSTAEVVLPRPVDARLLMRAVLEQLGRVPAVLMTPHAARMAERLRDRLKNPMIRDVFDRWFKLSRAVGRVPTLAEAGELRLAENDNHVLMEVNEHPSALVFRVIQVGAALTARLGRDMTGEVITSNEEEDVLGSMSLAYRRCVGGHAHHDYAKMALGQGCRVNIDRLLMPVSHDSDNVTHMLGVIVISEIKS